MMKREIFGWGLVIYGISSCVYGYTKIQGLRLFLGEYALDPIALILPIGEICLGIFLIYKGRKAKFKERRLSDARLSKV